MRHIQPTLPLDGVEKAHLVLTNTIPANYVHDFKMKFTLVLSAFAATMSTSMAVDESMLGSPWAGTFLDNLDPVNATECETSMLQTFSQETFRSISQAALPGFFELENRYALSKVLPRELALRVPESDEAGAFPDGTGNKLLKVFRDLKQFWDTSDDVVLRSLNADIILDAEGLKQAYMNVRGWDSARAEAAASRIQEIVADFPELGPSFPLWTLTAFAWFPTPGRAIGTGIAIGGKIGWLMTE